MKFRVMRRHFGDRLYEPGDTRSAEKAEVQHLIDNGVLAEDAPSKKKAPKAKDKAAPKNRNKAG